MNRLWHVMIIGAMVGLLVGVSLQIARGIQHEREMESLTQQFALWSPPLLSDFLKPEVIPVASSLLFASLGAVVWVARSRQER